MGRNLRGAVAVLIAVAAALILIEARRPDPGTAKWVASKVKDPPDNCGSSDTSPLPDRYRAAWGSRAQRSAIIHCGDAGPALTWAHFRTSADRDAALRAEPGQRAFVCRADRDLVLMDGFSRKVERATCEALDGRPV